MQLRIVWAGLGGAVLAYRTFGKYQVYLTEEMMGRDWQPAARMSSIVPQALPAHGDPQGKRVSPGMTWVHQEASSTLVEARPGSPAARDSAEALARDPGRPPGAPTSSARDAPRPGRSLR
jgi:hypothetical protein